MKIGDTVDVHVIRALGADDWIAAKVIKIEFGYSFAVEAICTPFDSVGHDCMWLRWRGDQEKPQQWRMSREASA